MISNILTGCNDILEDVFIFLDMTKYFSKEEQDRTIDFVRTLISPMDLTKSSARVKVAFSSNSFSSTTLFTFLKYQLDKDLDGFKTFSSGGDTRLKYALEDIMHSIRNQQIRPGASVKVVAFVDGLSDYHDSIYAAGELKRERAEVNIIYMKVSNKTNDLQAAASSPTQSHLFSLTTPDILQQFEETYLRRVCFKCKEKEGIYFVVDLSESFMSSPNIDFLLGFVKIATYALDIRDDGSRIALLAFDGLEVTAVVDFGTYASKQDFIRSLERLRTFTAINSAAKGTATALLGDKKVALIITDGTSKNHTVFLEYVERMKNTEGIEVFVIAVSYAGMLNNLYNVASEHKDEHLIQVQSLLEFLRYPNVTLLQNRRCASKLTLYH
ncbi:hypothetical protein CHS0354_016895 [Potamilus streckersoni]|uniref:VWFA domain-containing protein n=1 Tax=Potamilus streckersoni TaxID=2493646 RepID=A0AAE0S8I5_9BIVA|nr:hypothetical protein CHS0354_016895 [Potamilus streckersoni]